MHLNEFAAFLSDETLLAIHNDLLRFVMANGPGTVPEYRANAERARRHTLPHLQERINGNDCDLPID